MRQGLVVAIGALIVTAGTAGAAGPVSLDDFDLKVGRILREGSYVTLNIALTNNAATFVSSVSVDCTALDAGGRPLETAPSTFDNVKAKATVYGHAIFSKLSGESRFDCRVTDYAD